MSLSKSTTTQAFEWKTLSEDAGATALSTDINSALSGGWSIFAVTLNSTANAYIMLLQRPV